MSVSSRPLFDQLAAEGVDVVVIGGFAAVSLGVPYITQDIDLCYSPERANLMRLAAALSPLHPRLRVSSMTDEEARLLPFQLDETTLRQTPILTLRTDAGDLDMMSSVPGIGSFEQVRAAAVAVELFGHTILVLDLPGLSLQSVRQHGPRTYSRCRRSRPPSGCASSSAGKALGSRGVTEARRIALRRPQCDALGLMRSWGRG